MGVAFGDGFGRSVGVRVCSTIKGRICASAGAYVGKMGGFGVSVSRCPGNVCFNGLVKDGAGYSRGFIVGW